MSSDSSPDAAFRLAAIVESSDDAIVSKDLNGVIKTWNRAAERMFGYTAEEAIGRSIYMLLPEDRHHEEERVLAHIRRGEKVDHFETIRRRKDGSLFPISLTVSPITDIHGVVIGASKIARDISERRHAEQERQRLLRLAQDNATITETLNNVGAMVVSGLDRTTIVQAVTDTATSLTGAHFGAFFYNVTDTISGETYQLYTLSGAPKEAFASFPQPRNTAIFGPTFAGEGVVRLDDVTADPRFGLSAPYFGMPPGHLPVRSYLAVPVKAQSSDVIGGLFFGHSDVGVFTEAHERLATGIASWASVALENSRLHRGVQDASRLKDEFLATLSHELRTPLNAILGFARMLRSGLLPADRQGRALETIERNAASLTQIVEDILDVSRIITGKIRLDVKGVDLGRVVQDALASVTPAADAKGVRVDVQIDAATPMVSGDSERLQQVIWNLLSNAVKFTPRGGAIQVTVAPADQHVDLVVRDTGIGIPRDFLPHVFDRFRQADSSSTRERGGLGLGLAITRHLIELHGGTVHVASDGPGQGATFRVELPLFLAPETAPPAPATTPVAAEPLRPNSGLHGIRVLVVDDDADALRLLREILESSDALVTPAGSALEALDLLERERFDVVVADLGMPRMDGYELIARLRQNADPVIRDTPAAALTAFARSEDRSRALRSGFQIHLSKPIDPLSLVATVNALTRRKVRADA